MDVKGDENLLEGTLNVLLTPPYACLVPGIRHEAPYMHSFMHLISDGYSAELTL